MIRALLIVCIATALHAQAWDSNIPVILDSIEVKTIWRESNARQLIQLSELNGSIEGALTRNTDSFIKKYGPGQLSTWSVRGSSSSQNGIYWNGININSPMFGLLDLSQLEGQEGQEISYSSIGTTRNQVHIGGVLNILFKPELIDNNFYGELTYSSIGEIRPRLYLSKAYENYKSNTQISLRKSNNEYYFIGRAQERAQTTHAGYHEWSISHNSHYTFNNTKNIQANIWLRGYDTEISPSLYQNKSTAWQQDHNYRVNLIFNDQRSNWPLEIQTAIIHDRIRYANPIFNLNDPANSSSYLLRLFTKKELANWDLSFGVEHTYAKAESANYDVDQDRHLTNLIIRGNRWWSKKLASGILFNLPGINGTMSSPSLSFETTFLFSENFSLSSQIVRAKNIPSLNDLYWSPGGNEQLKPEKAWKTSVGVIYNTEFNDNIVISTEISIFSNWTQDWILWQPISGLIWSPINIRSVWNRGLSANAQLSKSLFNHGQVSLRMSTEYVSATYENQITANDKSIGNQLIYVPKWKTTGLLAGQYDGWGIKLNGQYTSALFTTTDNENSISAYTIWDVSFSKIIVARDFSFNVSAVINNMTNTSYQVVLDRPMPLRYYALQFKINF